MITPTAFTFPSPDPGTFLLAAIDPTAENQLVHLNASIHQGRGLTERDAAQPFQPSFPIARPGGQPVFVPGYYIPILLHTQLPGQITLHAQFTRINTPVLDPQKVLARGGAPYLERFPQQTLFAGSVPLLQNAPQQFSVLTLVRHGQIWQHGYTADSRSVQFKYTPSQLTYRSKAPPPGQSGPAYTLVPHGKQGPEVAFRTLHPLYVGKSPQSSVPSAFYDLEPVGQFTGDALAAEFSNPLNWLPEETYTPLPVVLQAGAKGHPLPPTLLLPTTNPAGFIIEPPLALTTLAAAEQMRGNDIISVIRVRVSGVGGATRASWQRIQQVAQEIEQRTGLRVLVTLGSSPKLVLVYVPGIRKGQDGATQDIAPLGWVSERWIAIGAATVYLTQLGQTRTLLLSAILAVCLGYLLIIFSALATAQRRAFAVLSALGWRPWQPARLLLGEALALAIAGGIVGLGLALLMVAALGETPLWPVVALSILAVLLLALLSAIYPLWQIGRLRPAEVLRAGTIVTSARITRLEHMSIHLLPPLSGLALRNLARGRTRTLLALGNGLFSAGLLTIKSIRTRHATPGAVLPGMVGAGILTLIALVDMLTEADRGVNKAGMLAVWAEHKESSIDGNACLNRRLPRANAQRVAHHLYRGPTCLQHSRGDKQRGSACPTPLLLARSAGNSAIPGHGRPGATKRAICDPGGWPGRKDMLRCP
jgi:hypothetical protein